MYEISTRTLRYASAGAPPALAFSPVGGAPTELATESAPVGTFEDTAFGPRSVHIEPGSRILVYSDGAYELAVDGHRQLSLPEFIGLCTRVNDSPDPSLDALISELRSIASAGVFTDDCSMIQLVFN